LFGKLVPEEKAGEFFGFFNTFGKAGAFIGPALVAIFITFFGNITIALTPVIFLFVAGGLVMLKVKEPNEITK
jgi:UMF1 family MFS transporter